MAENDAVSSTKPPPPPRPTIALPPRASAEAWFAAGGFGASPGPMTLVSSFFSDADPDSESRSLSQLIAGPMASPAAAQSDRRGGGSAGESASGGADLRFKQSLPPVLLVTQPQVFTIPPGLSPASLLESPGLFRGQGPFGMSHQQALAHVTVQAQSNMYMQGGVPTSLTMTPPTSLAPFSSTKQELLPPASNSRVGSKEESHFPSSDERPQPSSIVVDKPADDGFNWRKYGQKQVKLSEFPRSYYKCTYPSCLVKKKVERSLDGQITEIIYKGQHNHPPPQSSKRGSSQSQVENASRTDDGLAFSLGRRDQESSQATGECLSSSEEVGDEGATAHEGDEDEPDAKRRSLEAGVSGTAASHRTVTEPKIIVQTTSEVDLLDDGYRWRKYGQKVVKGNPYPRSYYKCTYQGCNVRKHIERASTDPKAVITTYEGKHNHDLPAPRASSHNTVPNNVPQPPPRPPSVSDHNAFLGKPDFPNDNHQKVAFLQLKEERIL